MLARAPHSLARARAPTRANRVKRAPAAFSMTPRARAPRAAPDDAPRRRDRDSDDARRSGRRATRARASIALTLTLAVTCAMFSGGVATTDGAVERPKARFQRDAPWTPSLGGVKKWRKKAKKAASTASKGVTKTANTASQATQNTANTVSQAAQNTANAASQAAQNTYNAGASLAGSTYSQTMNNLKGKFGDDMVNAFVGDSRDMLQSKYDATKGFTSSAVTEMMQETQKLASNVEAVAEMIVAFFNGLQCNIGPETMTDFTKSLTRTFKSSGTADLVNLIRQNPGKFYQALDGAACDTVWNTVFTSSSAAIDVFGSAINALKSKCPALGGASPAFTLGFTLDVDVNFATTTSGVGTELGVGFDLKGNKFCYVGACVSHGRTYGSNAMANADASPGLALSGYKELTSVPGECSMLDVGLSVSLPHPISVEGGGGLTYLYSGGLGNFVGVQYPMSLSGADPVPGADVSFKRGMCCTPICVKTNGAQCSPTNWKNPCPTAANPNAYLDLITASSSAALGGKRTLDLSDEVHTKYYRRTGERESRLGGGASERLSQSTMVMVTATVSMLGAFALALVAHRRRTARKVADESTPLIK